MRAQTFGRIFLAGLLINLMSMGGLKAQEADTPYENAEQGFSISYPKKWKKQEGGGEQVVRFTSPKGAPVTVFRHELPPNFGFQAFFRLEIVRFKKVHKNFKVLENGGAPIAGHNAKKYMYSFTHNDKPLQCVTYYLSTAKKGGGANVYKIECLVKKDDYFEFKEIFWSIAKSFKFKK